MNELPLAGAGGKDEALQEATAIGAAFAKAHHEAEVCRGFHVEDMLADDVSLNFIRQGKRFSVIFERCLRGGGGMGASRRRFARSMVTLRMRTIPKACA